MTNTATLTLATFLLARIAEDAAVARAAVGSSALAWQEDRYRVVHGGEWEVAEANVQTAAHIARHDPARVLAECEAKRQIVEAAQNIIEPDPSRRAALEFVCGRLASAYADHPDYRPEWRP